MRVLAIHNRYQQSGGEDIVFAREVSLLRAKGDEVFEYVRTNEDLTESGWADWVAMPITLVWSSRSYRDVIRIIGEFKPDVAHFHNTFLAVSPSAYYACKARSVPVVQALHNPRALCPSSNLHRDGKVCTECVGRPFAWPGVLHGCYRNSHLFSAGVAWLTAAHRFLSARDNLIDRYVVFTHFYERLFTQAGLPASKLAVKPHFLFNDPGERAPQSGEGYVLYAGRLEAAKGCRTLLSAWRHLDGIPLVVAGDGAMLPEFQSAASSEMAGRITLAGKLSWPDLVNCIQGARFLIWPSEGFNETFGNIAMEAMACGVPVLASSIGVAPEIVTDGVTGLLFSPSDPSDLAATVKSAWQQPKLMCQLGRQARGEFERRFTAETNYIQLRQIYAAAIGARRGAVPDGTLEVSH